MQPSRSKRKRQSRLAFTPLPSSSPAAKQYNKQIQDRAAAVTLDVSSSPAKRRKLRDDNETDGAAMPTPALTNDVVVEELGTGDDSDVIHVKQRKHATTNRQRQIDFSRVRDPSSFDSPIRLASSARSRQHQPGTMFSSPARSRRVVTISSDEYSEEDSDDITPPSSAPRRHSAPPVHSAEDADAPQADDVELDSDDIVLRSGRKDVPTPVADDSDEEDEMPTTQGKQRRSRRGGARQKVVDATPTDSDEEDLPVKTSSRRRRTRKNHQAASDEEELPAARSSGRKRSRALTQQEKEDLAEDLDALASSESEEQDEPFSTYTSTQVAQKQARASALEKLKRKRSGLAGDQAAQPIDVDGESEEAELSYDDDEEDWQEPTSSRHVFRETEDDAAFLVEDDDLPLGVPEHMPLEFTRYASMKPKELFRYAVEWFVQRKINPAYERNDQIYELTFKKLDDEVRGLAGSKFTSSAWTLPFTLALQARPEIRVVPIDQLSELFGRGKCDACNRSGHPATYSINFIGRPYDRNTMEDITQLHEENSDDATSSSSSDASDDDTDSIVDSAGRALDPSSKTYYVGKFCRANAETAHALNHWRYHLNAWVETWLEKRQYCTAARIVERDSWQTKKRRRYANKIVDRMEADGVVKQLYRDFKSSTDKARDSKQGRYGGYDSP